MKLLAFDTSSKSGTFVALEWDADQNPGWEGVRLVTELTLNVDATHSERILWGIHNVLEAARWTLKDVDVIGVGVGPGSFTGLRIGMTTARTLAHTLKKPLVPISSLAALARPIALHFASKDFKNSTLIVAATDACKGELFALWGEASQVAGCVRLPDPEAPGLWKDGVSEEVVEPANLMKTLKKQMAAEKKGCRWIAVGEGVRRYSDSWDLLPQARKRKDPYPIWETLQGRYLGMLAWEAVQAGLAQEALRVHPRYLRASDAEVKLKKGILKKAPTGDLDG